MSYPRYMRIPRSASIEQRPVSATAIPESCTDFLGIDQRIFGAARVACVRGFRYVVADVFTETPLQGNQLAVFTDARDISEELLQPLAREMNYSETVFVLPAEGDGHARIRIFTPTTEIPFAGHPTLGTAFVLAGPLQVDEIRLETGAGVVPVRLERDGQRIGFGRMEQPLPSVEPFGADEERLLAALGVE